MVNAASLSSRGNPGYILHHSRWASFLQKGAIPVSSKRDKASPPWCSTVNSWPILFLQSYLLRSHLLANTLVTDDGCKPLMQFPKDNLIFSVICFYLVWGSAVQNFSVRCAVFFKLAMQKTHLGILWDCHFCEDSLKMFRKLPRRTQSTTFLPW